MLIGSKAPGPGTYKTDIEKSPGKTVLSTFRSSPNTIFSDPKFARFRKEKNEGVPGPGQYFKNQEFTMSDHLSSTYKYQGPRSFAKSTRDTFYKKNVDTPGPGSYRMPSEFGYYESKSIIRNNPSLPNLKKVSKK